MAKSINSHYGFLDLNILGYIKLKKPKFQTITTAPLLKKLALKQQEENLEKAIDRQFKSWNQFLVYL